MTRFDTHNYKVVTYKGKPEAIHSFWLIDNGFAYFIAGNADDLEYCTSPHPVYPKQGVQLQPGEDLLAALDRVKHGRRSHIPGRQPPQFVATLQLEDAWIQPGEYYPRMAMQHAPFMQERFYLACSRITIPAPDQRVVALSLVSLSSLADEVKRLFGVIHPDPANFNAYGAESRNLLILCCTEVEAQWKGVLKANGYANSRPNTTDYVKLLRPMLLDEYEVTLPLYPWLTPIKPFHGWNPALPTQSLPWYDAYNAVKHDRENEFSRATLGHVITALCAIAAMVPAQYGEISTWRDHLGRFVEITKRPTVPLRNRSLPPFDPNPNVVFPETATPINYPF
jgi:hypothetical protein